MTKVFKNYILNIFIAIAFLFSQIVNANANHLNNSFQKENVSVSVIEKATNMATLYISNLNYGVGNEATVEGKVEKVLEPITLGAFGISILAGYGIGTIGIILAWPVGQIQKLISSR
ncbi:MULTISPECIES: hypothetical protein [unclassified Bartonella]|uniref:hypothetical protein n=1 Tax=unclassified Bartonella TaxID=2645622 RepID=UPI0035D08A2C